MFKKHDRFRSKDNGARGTITAVSFNSIHQEWEYYITWDNWPDKGELCYDAHKADDLWEKIGQLKDALDINTASGEDLDRISENMGIQRLPVGNNFSNPGIISSKECEHKWVDVGFSHSKIVCYHCGTNKL